MSAPQLAPVDEQCPDQIRSRPCPNCYVCGSRGDVLHEGLSDRLFGAAGVWDYKRCPARGCDLVWLDPMPLEEDIPRAYREYYTHHEDPPVPDNVARRAYCFVRDAYVASKYGYRSLDKSGWGWWLRYLAYLNPIRRANFDGGIFFLSPKPNGRLLEVGCGNGATLGLLKGLGWEVEGIDFDAAAVERARGRGLRVHLGTLGAQGLPAESFDAVVSSHVIEHVADPVGLLRECRRLLKPGGQLTLITPNSASWGHRIYGPDWRGLEPPRHLHIFAEGSLKAVAARAGFTQCRCNSLVRANGVLLMSRMLRKVGRVDIRRPPLALRLWAEATGLVQWSGSLVDRHAGEEIILTGTKDESA